VERGVWAIGRGGISIFLGRVARLCSMNVSSENFSIIYRNSLLSLATTASILL